MKSISFLNILIIKNSSQIHTSVNKSKDYFLNGFPRIRNKYNLRILNFSVSLSTAQMLYICSYEYNMWSLHTTTTVKYFKARGEGIPDKTARRREKLYHLSLGGQSVPLRRKALEQGRGKKANP